MNGSAKILSMRAVAVRRRRRAEAVNPPRVINLRTPGATLTLHCPAGVLSLSPDDLEFIAGILRQVEAYEATPGKEPAP
jgi:hypothetical protein